MSKSTAPVSDRLREHLRKLVDEIRREVESGLYSGSPEAVADSRETVLGEILSRFLPRTFDVAKGKIFDSHGNLSDSIDIVLLAGNHPKFRNARGEIELLMADGVYAALELKPVLTDLPALDAQRSQSPEIWRALDQARSVKRLRRVRSMLIFDNHSAELDDYSKRVPTYLITMKAPPIAELAQYIAEYYVHHQVPLVEQVDTVVALDHGLIVNLKYREHFFVKTKDPFSPALLAFKTSNSLAELLLMLMQEIGPEPLLAHPILPAYLGDVLQNERAGVFKTTAG